MKMKSAARGSTTSNVEVTNISPNGVWLLVEDRECFLSFGDFPWFRDASVAQVLEVERPSSDHLYWPSLDIDLSIESLEHPERFPLIARG
jgi:hypothetical protein